MNVVCCSRDWRFNFLNMQHKKRLVFLSFFPRRGLVQGYAPILSSDFIPYMIIKYSSQLGHLTAGGGNIPMTVASLESVPIYHKFPFSCDAAHYTLHIQSMSGGIWFVIPFVSLSIRPSTLNQLGRVAQSVGHLTCKSRVLVRYQVWQHTFVSPSAFSTRAVVSYWQKYVHEVLVNHLGGLSLPRKSVVRLTDCPDMTLDVYRGRKTTIQQL